MKMKTLFWKYDNPNSKPNLGIGFKTKDLFNEKYKTYFTLVAEFNNLIIINEENNIDIFDGEKVWNSFEYEGILDIKSGTMNYIIGKKSNMC